MIIKVKYEYGDSVYIKHDPEQIQYELVGVIGRPGSTSFELSHLGEVIEMYDFQVSKTRDEMKMLGLEKNKEEE